jgi:hypothetical protein
MTSATAGSLFVLGAPRSGTSALYKALCLHPRAFWLSNWDRQLPHVAAMSAVSRVAALAPATRRRVWFGTDGGTAYAYGAPRGLLTRAFPQPVEGEPVFEAAGVPVVADTATTTDRQRRLPRSIRTRARLAGGEVFVSKRIAHNTRVPLLHALFPDARFVHITRDGRAVASSLSRVNWWQDSPLWWYGGTPRGWESEGREPMDACARHWVEEVQAIERGLQSVPEEQALHLRYEDLVSKPAEVLHTLAAFGGLGPSARWDRSLEDVRFPDQNEAWQERLGEKAARVEDIQRDALRRLGYL